jgi:hypothetical protein
VSCVADSDTTGHEKEMAVALQSTTIIQIELHSASEMWTVIEQVPTKGSSSATFSHRREIIPRNGQKCQSYRSTKVSSSLFFPSNNSIIAKEGKIHFNNKFNKGHTRGMEQMCYCPQCISRRMLWESNVMCFVYRRLHMKTFCDTLQTILTINAK